MGFCIQQLLEDDYIIRRLSVFCRRSNIPFVVNHFHQKPRVRFVLWVIIVSTRRKRILKRKRKIQKTQCTLIVALILLFLICDS